MKLKLIILAIISAFILTACHKHEKTNHNAETAMMKNEEGDSTLYGLACDTNNDSVISIMSYNLDDPQNYSIIPAFRNHQIHGYPTIGSNIAVILSADKKSAERIINVDKLCGTWSYLVVPELQKPAAMTASQFQNFRQHFMTKISDEQRDSIFKPIEYNIQLHQNKTVSCTFPIKTINEDRMQIVKYPRMKLYNAWKLYNGHLLLTATKPRNSTDTCDFEITHKDTLIIHFKNKTQHYYRNNNE
ncbi:MAG: hypothetical protein MJY52_03585 [Bacteroidaceae bacterium]|nr:hypothetical protein [Bacteroidaceae bacterium]